LVFGAVAPPQGDLEYLTVHSGCTKEVSSFEAKLKNWDSKYLTSPNVIAEAVDGHVDVGRGLTVPQLITCHVESLIYESSATEHYLTVKGRCWGERLFRKNVTFSFANEKGEDVVRYIIDYYVGLDHCRVNSLLTADAAAAQKVCAVVDGTKFTAGMLVKIADGTHWEYNEVASVSDNDVTMVNDLVNTYEVVDAGKVWVDLIEKTDTTYTLLEYADTLAFDIVTFIANTADKDGVIGYDFRVAPDAKFEFFPRLSKLSSVSLSEKIETADYKRDVSRVRNKIKVKGAAEKAYPTDKDGMTENLTANDTQLVWSPGGVTKGWWEEVGDCEVSLESTVVIKGSYSVECWADTVVASSVVDWWFYNPGYLLNAEDYPSMSCQIYREIEPGKVGFKIELMDINNQKLRKMLDIWEPEKWKLFTLGLGSDHADEWIIDEFNTQAFDWTQIRRIRFEAFMDGNQTGKFYVDNMFFNHKRWSSMKESIASQIEYTDSEPREYTETDEELHSDEECALRAQALLAWLKDPAEYVTIFSTVLDYGSTPILGGDKQHVSLPNENVDADFKVSFAEYVVDVERQILTVNIELGREPPLYADYIFALRKNERKLARYKIARL
jgi:hypothetical protein